MHTPNWRTNLQRRGGFWRNGSWYDLHLERRMPLVLPMLEELLMALPPLGPDALVCDIACGTGNASLMVLEGYPMVQLTAIDEDADILDVARSKIRLMRDDATFLRESISMEGDVLPGAPYDLVIGSLALHAIVGHDVEGAEAESRYELLLQGIRNSLMPGGHLIVGDHVGVLPLFRQLKAFERAGFTDVDCAWRQDDFFVAGGRVAQQGA